MFAKLGEKLTDFFQKYMPDSFVFAILMTLFTVLVAYFWVDATPMKIISSWYGGFWSLLEFGMQIILMIITGFSIALSPFIKNGIDKLSTYFKTPFHVYFFVVLIGSLLTIVSFGWIVITCVLARELALRVKGIHYPYLIACVYFSSASWVTGLSSSIPLLLNTENNFLMEAGILQEVIPTSNTLGSPLNLIMVVIMVIMTPLLLVALRPKKRQIKDLTSMLSKQEQNSNTIKEEAHSLSLPFKPVSDKLNNSFVLQLFVVIMGFTYIVYHFYTKGMDLNFNIMIFIFLMVGLFLHKTPLRYAISMKRASGNISGILFQYPFYAGIMGIMIFTGLGEKIAMTMANVATMETYAFFAYITGLMINFAIPSAGGEFAVIGPSIINAVQEIGMGLPQDQIIKMISRASMSVAYGESLSNALQPFYLLLVFPVMAKGIKIQARDIMGYLFIPLLLFFIIQSALIVLLPL